MRKVLTIGWKDLVVIWRDRTALLLMLGAPFVLTLGLGLVTGAFSQSETGTGLADIPLAIVNDDNGRLGAALVDTLTADDLADLLQPQTAVSAAAARQMVDADEIAAAVIIPADFSASLQPDPAAGATAVAATVEVYANPARTISAGVVESIVHSFVEQAETERVGVQVTMQQLITSGRLGTSLEAAQMVARQQTAAQAAGVDETAPAMPINVRRSETAVANDDFNLLAYITPGMAVLFLMYTVTYGSRSILAERSAGTLGRLLTTPTSTAQVLGGKVIGIFLSGAAQVGVLIAASALLFGVRWGDPLAVALIIITVSAAATGWGLLLAAAARSPRQVSSVGSAMMLIFGILGGSFVQLGDGGIVGWLSKLTPNAWAIDGFVALAAGDTLADILPMLQALVVMAAVLFLTAVVVYRRNTSQFR